jgi:hypothetical protein
MKRYEFRLSISSERCLDYYRGAVQQVVVRCFTGETVQFPAGRIQRFVTEKGVHGRFVLTCDANHRCVDLQKVDD